MNLYEYYGICTIRWKELHSLMRADYSFEEKWLEYKRKARTGVILSVDGSRDKQADELIIHALYREEEKKLIHDIWPDVNEQPYLCELPEVFHARVYRHDKPWKLD